MSCESTSVHFEGITDGDGGDVSGDCALSTENPIAIDVEIPEAGDKASSISMEESCRPKKTSKIKLKTCCEWAVIITVIVVIWGLLALPTVYYHTFQVR